MNANTIANANLHEATPLQAMQRAWRRGELPKADFIARACELHQALWAYAPQLADGEVREISIRADGVRFRMGEAGLLVEAPRDEARVAPLEAINFGAYEPRESAVMDVLAEGARCILDVGANIGWHAIRLAVREPQAVVHAFEPMPQAHEHLCRNIAHNGLAARVRAHGFGLSKSRGSVEFFIAPRNGTNASLVNVAGRDDARRVVGLTMTMDDWTANTGAAPDYIKIDVEGAELWVLEGGMRTIERHRPAIFVELLRKWSAPFGYHPDEVVQRMAALGYGCWAVGDSGLRRLEAIDEQTEETNFAFLHERAHAAKIRALWALGAAWAIENRPVLQP